MVVFDRSAREIARHRPDDFRAWLRRGTSWHNGRVSSIFPVIDARSLARLNRPVVSFDFSYRSMIEFSLLTVQR